MTAGKNNIDSEPKQPRQQEKKHMTAAIIRQTEVT